jgi:hypothetical protein
MITMVQCQGTEAIVPLVPFNLFFPKTLVTFLGKKGMEAIVPFR